MAGLQKKQWGLSPPISDALPTEQDKALHDSLIKELVRENNFEKPEDAQKRKDFLEKLQTITEAFVREVGRKKNMAQSVIDDSGGKVFTFGSYKLGVLSPGSDVDTLIVAPKHVTRDDFFEFFPNILRDASAPGAMESLVAVQDTGVPIIKLMYTGLDIDMIFASLKVSSVPRSLDLDDKKYLRGLDDTDLKSVNGTRVTDRIVSLVPQVQTFRHALRAVKLWAQRRAIYGNSMGFPGGVSWAMMVARVCQLYPMAPGAVLVPKFFFIMMTWKWPNPVQLQEKEEGSIQQREWNPAQFSGDARHLMPVLTPAFPQMNSTYSITPSTHKIIKKELRRAHAIAQDILSSKKTWKDLFEKHTFFTQDYKYYLSVIAAARTADAHSKWKGFVGAKFRKLIMGIEGSDASVGIARPFNKGFERVHHCKTDEHIEQVLQGSMAYLAKDVKTQTTDAGNEIKQQAAAEGTDASEAPEAGDSKDEPDQVTIYTTTFYVGIELEDGAKTLDISWPVSDFKRVCTEDYDQYDGDLMSIRIVHTRNYDLPDDLFGPGETKPVKAAKKKLGAKVNGHGAPKRNLTEAGLDGLNGHTAKRRQPSNGISTGTG